MNKPLLIKVAKRILKNPEQYDQASYCGTACCIAGHACLIADGKIQGTIHDSFRPTLVSIRARELLDLTHDRFDSLCLRYNYWPEPFKQLFADADTKEQEAQIAHDRIMHMVKTGE